MLFLSYARKNLYFAEAVVLRLQAAGIPIWFDLQQLEPGCQWIDEIDRGLQTCDGVLVIASADALQSKYVRLEWQHAMDSGRPVHLLLFEAVDFAAFDSAHLAEEAVSVIDARIHFDAAIMRLAEALKGKPVRDPLPAPNRGGLPAKLPLAVAFVAGAMASLTLVTVLVGFQAAAVFFPAALLAVLVAIWLADQTRQFILRQSYRETRLALIAGTVIASLFYLWAVPILAFGAWFSLTNADVHRYSPLGQGLKGRHRAAVYRSPRGKRGSLFDRLVSRYHNYNLIFKIILYVVLLFVAFLILALPALREESSIFVYLYLFGTPLVISVYLNRSGRLVDERPTVKPTPTSVIFVVLASFADDPTARQVRNSMLALGHREVARHSLARLEPDDGPVVALVVLSSLTVSDALSHELERLPKHRPIFILSSPLEDPTLSDLFGQYQWVDYRRHGSERLDALAEELYDEDNVVTRDFATRLVPQSFVLPVLPTSVLIYIVLQFLSFSLAVFNLTSGTYNFIGPLGILVTVLGMLVAVWVTVQVALRQISVRRILTVNFSVGTFSLAIGTLIGLELGRAEIERQGLRAEVNLTPLLISLAIALPLGYILARGLLQLLLSEWLPPDAPPTRIWPRSAADKMWWRRHLVTAIAVGLFTLVLVSPTVPLANGSRGRPVAALLQESASPVGVSLATWFD